MKRFWREVSVVAADRGSGIALDGKPVRTPGRLPLVIPTVTLAEAVADEWRAVEGDVTPQAMPLTGLANAAIERIAPDLAAFAAGLASYAESDLLCYRAIEPPPLAERQQAAWDPLLGWARQRYDVHFETVAGVMHRVQPAATLARLSDTVAARNPFELAALAPIVTVTGSLVLALALLEGAIDPDTAWIAARIDDDWQAEMWGQDELADRTAAAHRADFDAGVRMLALL